MPHLTSQRHLVLTWKEHDSRVIKQYNICACIQKHLDNLRVATASSSIQRCPAIVVLPMGARSRKTRSTCLMSTWDNSTKGHAKLGLRSSAFLQRGVSLILIGKSQVSAPSSGWMIIGRHVSAHIRPARDTPATARPESPQSLNPSVRMPIATS